MNCKADWADKEKILISTEIAKDKTIEEITKVVGRYLNCSLEILEHINAGLVRAN